MVLKNNSLGELITEIRHYYLRVLSLFFCEFLRRGKKSQKKVLPSCKDFYQWSSEVGTLLYAIKTCVAVVHVTTIIFDPVVVSFLYSFFFFFKGHSYEKVMLDDYDYGLKKIHKGNSVYWYQLLHGCIRKQFRLSKTMNNHDNGRVTCRLHVPKQELQFRLAQATSTASPVKVLSRLWLGEIAKLNLILLKLEKWYSAFNFSFHKFCLILKDLFLIRFPSNFQERLLYVLSKPRICFLGSKDKIVLF